MKRIIASILLVCFIFSFCGIAIADDTKYIGSKKSNKYHYTWCRYGEKIKPSNMVTFDSPDEAQSYGYIPCKVCKPPRSE